MSITTNAAKQPRMITGRMVLIGFIAFFGVVGTVNGIFMYLALHTWPGLTTEHSYTDGLAYNQTLAAAERQVALGWHSTVTLAPGAIGQPHAVTVNVIGKDGAELNGLDVALTFERAVGIPNTSPVPLRESAPGTYTGTFTVPLMGRWQAYVTAKGVDGAQYQMMHDVTAHP